MKSQMSSPLDSKILGGQFSALVTAIEPRRWMVISQPRLNEDRATEGTITDYHSSRQSWLDRPERPCLFRIFSNGQKLRSARASGAELVVTRETFPRKNRESRELTRLYRLGVNVEMVRPSGVLGSHQSYPRSI
jgi:hypothetical protein